LILFVNETGFRSLNWKKQRNLACPDAVQRISAQELLKLVQQLSPATQTVFNLYVIEGYNHREIANLIGISEGTSKWHLSEARRQLQKLLQTLQV
jgi:RNA polymerase sigma-70 factor (ECF subfamily)